MDNCLGTIETTSARKSFLFFSFAIQILSVQRLCKEKTKECVIFMLCGCPFAAGLVFFLCGINSAQLTLMSKTCLSFMMLCD